jgi:hypothetical protein
VATTAPNFVRGAVVPITSSFIILKGSVGVLYAGAIVGVVSFSLAILALVLTHDTFHKDLDYIEV